MHLLNPMTRRTMLRGVGAAIALPLLETFAVRRAFAASQAIASPKRLIFLSYGWGVTEKGWFPDPTKVGPGHHMSECLEPLRRHEKDFSVLSNLSNFGSPDGHWGCTTWLTSAHVRGTPGKEFQNSVSVDQVAARELGRDTRFSSLELSCPEKPDGGFGPGGSLAWSSEGNPIAGEISPVALFDRLFGAVEVSREARLHALSQQQSVLDAVLDDAKSLDPQLSKSDREKVSEYLQSVRDLELRIAKNKEWVDRPKPKAPLDRPAAPANDSETVRLMYDLMVAAIQTDSCRVLSYRQPSGSFYAELGYPSIDGHITTHHHEGDARKASLARDKKQAELLAYLIDRLKALKEPNGSSVFDNTLIAYGSEIRTSHDLVNLATLVAGHGGGGINQGQHFVYESKQTPLSNLWLGLLQHVGIRADRFADSVRPLPGLFA